MKKYQSHTPWLRYLKVYCVSVSPHTELSETVLLESIVTLSKFTQKVRLVVNLRLFHVKMI